MGTAKRSSSPANKAGYTDIKREAHNAFVDDDVPQAVDLLITLGLAAQPNGPAKLPMYAYAKHTATFVNETNEHGLEQGLRTTGVAVAQGELTGAAAAGVVDGIQESVTTAAEGDLVDEGTVGNKNLNRVAEQAMQDAVGEMIGKGANALQQDNKETNE